jgi:F-type H+-transporting ATPase subunit b
MFFLAFAEVQLVPDGTIFIHIALILLMIWILNRTFFRPINRVVESREKNKGGRFSEAETILQQVNEKQSKYNQAMLEARTRGYETIETERAAALAQRETKITEVKTEVAQRFEQEKAQLQTQTTEARTAIAAEADKLAEKISSNILRSA